MNRSKKRRLLYIEPYKEAGHANVNASFLSAIAKLECEVVLVSHAECIERMPRFKNVSYVPLPAGEHMSGAGRIRERIAQIRIFNHIAKEFDPPGYDAVFLSSFDEIALLASNLRGRIFALAHGNISGMRKWLKRWCMLKMEKFATIVVFNDLIAAGARAYGLTNICVEPHGFGPRISVEMEKVQLSLESIQQHLPRRIRQEELRVVFAPAGAKYGDDLLARLANSKKFHEYLVGNRILLIAKGIPKAVCGSNLVNIERYLTESEFAAIFMAANLILLSYPPTFDYRVSALLFESFANNKACVVSDIEAFRTYGRYFRYDPFFRGEGDLENRISAVLASEEVRNGTVYQGLDELVPSLDTIFS